RVHGGHLRLTPVTERVAAPSGRPVRRAPASSRHGSAPRCPAEAWPRNGEDFRSSTAGPGPRGAPRQRIRTYVRRQGRGSGPVAVEGGGPGGGVAATVEPGVVGVGGRCYERVS